VCVAWALCAAAPAVAVKPLSQEGQDAATPDLAINARGEIAVLWTDQDPAAASGEAARDDRLSYVDLYVAVSKDGGATFANPVKVNQQAGLVRALSVNRPRIAAGAGSVWHVSYTANEIHPRFNKPVLTTHYTRSRDGGASFEPSRRMSSWAEVAIGEVAHIHGGYAAASAFGTMAAARDGRVAVLWIDSRNMTPASDVRALYARISADDGASFGPETELLRSEVCPCCQMTAAADDASNIYLGLRMVTADGARPASVARLATSGALGGPVDAGGARWQIDGCPLKPTAVAARGRTVVTAVYNGGAEKPGVYMSWSKDGGASFAAATAVHPDALVSDAPTLAINARSVLLAWHGKTDGARRLFYRMFDLDGRPLGAISAVADAGDGAQNPVAAVRQDGRFQIVWQQSGRVFTAVLGPP